MRLTDWKLIGLKPKPHAYDICEGNGFVVRVYPTGRKVFQFVYQSSGKQHRVSIGEYPTVITLAEAREKHARLYRAVKRGEQAPKVALTVNVLAERYLSKWSENKQRLSRPPKNA